MPSLMRCLYCGLLQDEPSGVKACARCGGELAYESPPPIEESGSYLTVQMELDQISAPSGRNCDRYLLVTVRTPAQVPPDQAAPTQSGRPPLNFCAILDVSGSMQGEKLAQAKEAVRHSLRYLRDGDVFSLVTFSNNVRTAFEPRPVDQNTRKAVESALGEMQAGGMTALDGGLALGLENVTQMRRDTNLALLLSDGQANVGETDLEKVGQRGTNARQQSIIISTLGVGADYNEALMAEIATQGGGRFYHLESAGQIPTYLTGELGEVASLAARQAVIHLDLPPGATLMPMSAAYPARQGDGKATVSIGDIPSETELEIPLRLSLPAQASGTRLSLEGNLEYHSPAGNLLNARLNRVTVRFVEGKEFHLQDGVVRPIAERVLGQMKASHVLGVSRAYARGAGEGEKLVATHIAELREYAARLGEERAEQEAEEAGQTLGFMAASPAAAKASVAAAFIKQRSTKDFKNKSG